MIDRATFRRSSPNYQFPTAVAPAPKIEKKLPWIDHSNARHQSLGAHGDPVPLPTHNMTSIYTGILTDPTQIPLSNCVPR